MKCDELKQVENPIEWGLYYDKAEVDEAIAELKDKCQMHDFFWEGCGFAKRGFKNAIAVREAFDRLEAENERLLQALNEAVQAQGFKNLNIPESLARLMGEAADVKGEARRKQHEIAELKRKLEDVQATAYAEMVDADENLRWRKTSEEIPSENDYYLVSDGKNVFMEYGSYNEQDEVWNWDHGENMDTWKYWRPMPKAPEEEK